MPTPPPDRAPVSPIWDVPPPAAAAIRAAHPAPVEDDPRDENVDPRVVGIEGAPSAGGFLGTSFSPEERLALGAELPMRRATVKQRILNQDTGEEDYEDSVQYGVDLAALRTRLSRAMLKHELSQRTRENPEYVPTPEETQALEAEFRKQAHARLVKQIQQTNNENYIFIDHDPEGTLEDLQQTGGLGAPVSNVVKAVLPQFLENKVLGTTGLIGAWLHGRGGRTYKPEFDAATGEWKVAEEDLAKREGVLGTLEFLGQPAPSTYLATAIAAGIDREKKGEVDLSDLPVVRQIQAYLYGEHSKEQIERVRAGEDMFSFTGEIGAAALPFVEDSTGLFANVVGAGLAFGVAMVEPDLISAMTFGLGKAARGVKSVQRTGEVLGKVLPMADKWSLAGKYEKTTQVTAEWAARIEQAVDSGAPLERVADLERQAAQEVFKLNPHLWFTVQSRLRATTALDETGDPRVSNAVMYALSMNNKGGLNPEDFASGHFMRKYLSRRRTVEEASARLEDREQAFEAVLAAHPQQAATLKEVDNYFWQSKLTLAEKEALLADLVDLPKKSPEVLKDIRYMSGQVRKAKTLAKSWGERHAKLLDSLPGDSAKAYKEAGENRIKEVMTLQVRRLAAQHYADTAVLEHMRVMRAGFDKLVQGSPKAVADDEAKVLTQAYQQSMMDYASAQRRILQAVDPGELRAAQDALYTAATAMRKTTLRGADAIAASGYKSLDDSILRAEELAKHSEERLTYWVDIAKDAGIQPSLSGHSRAIKGLKSAEFQASRERIVTRAFADTLTHVSQQYQQAAKLVRTGDLEKLDLTKASKALVQVLSPEGTVDASVLVARLTELFGEPAVRRLSQAATVPDRLRNVVDGLRAVENGGDLVVALAPTQVHDLVSAMRGLRSAASVEGAETALGTEMRRRTLAGLDELLGVDLPANEEMVERVYAALLKNNVTEPVVPAAQVQRTMEKLFGADAVMAARKAARVSLEVADGKVLPEVGEALNAMASGTGTVDLTKVLPQLVSTLNTQRKAIVQAKSTSRIAQKLLPALKKTWRMLQRTGRVMTDPAGAKLGMMFNDDNLLQIGKGVIDHTKVVQREIVEIASSVTDPTDRATRMLRYITDPTASFPAFRAVGHSALGNKSLWQGAAILWHGMTADERLADNLLRGLSRIWIKDGTVMPPKGEQVLMGVATKLLEDAKMVTTPDGVRMLDLEFSTFSDAMLKATVRLEQNIPTLERVKAHRAGEQVRAMGYAAQLIGATASVQRAVDALSLRMVGVSPEMVENVQRFLGNNEGAIDTGFDEVFQFFVRMGIPPKSVEQAQAMGKSIERGILAIRDSDGNMGAFPKEWHHFVVKEAEPLLKRWVEASDATKDTLPPRVWEFMRTCMRVWRTSVTSGVALMSPRYLATNSFGLISQIGMEDSFLSAFKAVASGAGTAAMESWPVQAMRHILPKAMGTALDERYLQALEANKGNRRGILNTVINAVYNPCVAAIYDTSRFGDSVVLPSRAGTKVTMGQLRSWLVQEGVLTSQASENMMEIMSRASTLSNQSRKWTLPWLVAEARGSYTATGARGVAGRATELAVDVASPSKMLKAFDERGQVLAGLADVLEQRQRAALFTDLVVNRGMHPEEAGRVVREATYDWNHAAVEDEAKALGPLVMFYRALKLMYRQGVRHAFDPFLRGFRDEGVRVYGGSLAKLRALEGTSEVLAGEYIDLMSTPLVYEDFQALQQTDPEAYQEHLEAWQMQQTSPWWMSSGQRTWLGTVPLSPEQQEGALVARGKPATHLATTMPSHTVLEFVGHIFGMGMGLASVATGGTSPLEATRKLGTTMAEMGGPLMGEGIQAAADMFLGTAPGAYRGDPDRLVPLRQVEQVLADTFPDALHAEWNAETNAWEVPQWSAALLRTSPVLGTEVLNYLQPAFDVRSGLAGTDGVGSASFYYMQQVSGLGRTYPFAPQKELENKSKYSIEAVVKEEERRAGGKKEVDAALRGVPGASATPKSKRKEKEKSGESAEARAKRIAARRELLKRKLEK